MPPSYRPNSVYAHGGLCPGFFYAGENYARLIDGTRLVDCSKTLSREANRWSETSQLRGHNAYENVLVWPHPDDATAHLKAAFFTRPRSPL